MASSSPDQRTSQAQTARVASVRIRRASHADAATLAELSRTTFLATYRDHPRADLLSAYVNRAYSTEEVQRELRDPETTLFLAIEEETPVGYAKLRVTRPREDLPGTRPINLERIYLLESAQGRGVGGALMEACLEEARRRKRDMLWLGVMKTNEPAIRFYERWGFEVVGEEEFEIQALPERVVDVDVLMALPLG
jgi:diamine N-acetyltransferase